MRLMIFAGRRAKPPSRTQAELEFSRPPAPSKPTPRTLDVEKAARLAISRRSQPGPGGKVRLTLTLYFTRTQAERLSARAIREEKNLEAVLAEILEGASG